MSVTIYHNPDCGTSRNTLALLESLETNPTIVPYLETPPNRDQLRELWQQAGLSVRDGLRRRGTPFAELNLDNPELSDDDLLDAVADHPILINRPLVVTERGVRLCRPADLVLDLVDITRPQAVDKEEGAPFLKDEPLTPDDSMKQALTAAGLPIDDLTADSPNQPGTRYFRYHDMAGTLLGYGGFELYGSDTLIRSIVVLDPARESGVGRNLLLLLMRRAFDQGARQAYILTTTAQKFFEDQRFKTIPRDQVPASILATKQATELCPDDAALLTRAIEL